MVKQKKESKIDKEVNSKSSKKTEKNSILISISSFFRENYKTFIFFILFFIIVNFPVPYYVFTSGGITDLSSRFEIEESYEQKGSYNLSYVSQLEGNILTYLLTYIVPGWEKVEIEGYQVNENESVEDMMVRDKLSLEQANQIATVLAYTKAQKQIDINNVNFYVVAIYDFLESDREIKIGDKLLKVDGIEIEEFDQITEYINATNEETLKLELERNEKTYETNVKIKNIEGSKMIGLAFYRLYDLNVTPKIEFTFAASESGSSAGLMTTLAIYDSLIPEDLTHGLKIAGTGTVDSEGNVGEIGGVQYKLAGANKGGAEIFFVPSGDNYKDAMKLKKEKGYDIEIVEVETLDDAINYLKNIKK